MSYTLLKSCILQVHYEVPHHQLQFYVSMSLHCMVVICMYCHNTHLTCLFTVTIFIAGSDRTFLCSARPCHNWKHFI